MRCLPTRSYDSRFPQNKPATEAGGGAQHRHRLLHRHDDPGAHQLGWLAILILLPHHGHRGHS